MNPGFPYDEQPEVILSLSKSIKYIRHDGATLSEYNKVNNMITKGLCSTINHCRFVVP